MRKLDFTQFNVTRKGVIDYADSVEGKLDRCRVDLTAEYPRLEFLLKRENTGVFPKGDIQAIKGKAKGGKSTFILTLAAALLKGDFNGFKAVNEGARVLYADTEQNARNTQLFGHKLCKLCGIDPGTERDRFVLYSFRGESVEARRELIERATVEQSPDILFIDGIRDLVTDFNAIDESGDIVGWLMWLSQEYNVSVCVVLHENKADGNMRGHLGTEITNKCSEVYQVAYDNGVMRVKQTECRNIPVKEFAFTIGSDGLPAEWDIPALSNTLSDKIRGNMDSVFSQQSEYKYTDLTNEYMEIAGVGKDAAKKHIAQALRDGTVIKNAQRSVYAKFDVGKI